MEMTQILPELRKLKRVEKLFIMQYLVSELAQEESELIQPGFVYPIWSPYDAFDAAATMLKVLHESKAEGHA
ncbi:MAG: hypothetical protein R2911_10475 [Caldilineaceae bacterium]